MDTRLWLHTTHYFHEIYPRNEAEFCTEWCKIASIVSNASERASYSAAMSLGATSVTMSSMIVFSSKSFGV